MRFPRTWATASNVATAASILLLCCACHATAQLEKGGEWRLTEEWRIGGAGDSALALTEVLDLTTDGARLYLAQWRDGSITVLDRQGKYVSRIGRSGSGPGEFSAPSRLGWHDGSLWVIDALLSRITLLSADGAVERMISFTAPRLSDTHAALLPIAFTSNGAVVALARTSIRFVEAGVVNRLPLVRVAGQAAADTIGWIDIRREEVRFEDPSGRSMVTLQPFAEGSLFAVGRRGDSVVIVDRTVAEGDAPVFRVSHVSVNGDTMFTRSYGYQPVSLAESHVSRVVRELGHMLASGGEVTQARAEQIVRDALYLPKYYPPVTAVTAGQDGTIWLRREEADDDSVQFTVIDETGAALAETSAPAGLKVLDVHGDRLWGVIKDSLDVPQIVAYRITKTK